MLWQFLANTHLPLNLFFSGAKLMAVVILSNFSSKYFAVLLIDLIVFKHLKVLNLTSSGSLN